MTNLTRLAAQALAHLEDGHDVRAWWCLDLLIRQMRARARVA